MVWHSTAPCAIQQLEVNVGHVAMDQLLPGRLLLLVDAPTLSAVAPGHEGQALSDGFVLEIGQRCL